MEQVAVVTPLCIYEQYKLFRGRSCPAVRLKLYYRGYGKEVDSGKIIALFPLTFLRSLLMHASFLQSLSTFARNSLSIS